MAKKKTKQRGRGKGQAFEREVCKALSLWLTGGERSDVFWRSSMSGGRATIAKGTVRQAGDLCAVAPEGHTLTDKYFIECKFNNRLELSQFILGGYGKIARHWEKACDESLKYKREPVLIAKQNFTPTIVISRRNELNNFVDPIAEIFNNAAKTYVSIYLFEEWIATEPPFQITKEAQHDLRKRIAARAKSASVPAPTRRRHR